MKTFGKKFKAYKPFKVEQLTAPGRQMIAAKSLGVPPLKFRKSADAASSKAAVGIAKANKIKKELAKAVIAVAPTANVYKIPSDQPDLDKTIKNTLAEFDYYAVELGLNVMLGKQFKIPELLLKIELTNNAKKTDVVAYDLAPDDKFEKIKIAGGKVSLGIGKLLQFIPSPVGKLAADLINIEINPWEFEWNVKKCAIDACGKKSYNLYWKVYRTDMVQSFNPALILKVRKNVKKISARAKCIYKLKTSWWDFEPGIKTNIQEIKIL